VADGRPAKFFTLSCNYVEIRSPTPAQHGTITCLPRTIAFLLNLSADLLACRDNLAWILHCLTYSVKWLTGNDLCWNLICLCTAFFLFWNATCLRLKFRCWLFNTGTNDKARSICCSASFGWSVSTIIVLFRIRIYMYRQSLFQLRRLSCFLHVPNQEIVREKMIFRRLLIFFPLDRIVLYDVLEIIQNILFWLKRTFFPMYSFSGQTLSIGLFYL
jgi:hypothetical protein